MHLFGTYTWVCCQVRCALDAALVGCGRQQIWPSKKPPQSLWLFLACSVTEVWPNQVDGRAGSCQMIGDGLGGVGRVSRQSTQQRVSRQGVVGCGW